MKKHLKGLCLLGITVVITTSGMTVSAGSLSAVTEESTEIQVTENDAAAGTEKDTETKTATTEIKEDPADDNVVIQAKDKPYLALGADLTADQQRVVLDAMGIRPEDLSNYDVSYVTNAEEHQYLDAYISSAQIGTKSWSSVVIEKKLLNGIEYYCTECGKKLSEKTNTGLCLTCYRKTTRKIERPSKEILKNLIENNSFTDLGLKFNVSDNTIRSWCKIYDLPYRKKDMK